MSEKIMVCFESEAQDDHKKAVESAITQAGGSKHTEVPITNTVIFNVPQNYDHNVFVNTQEAKDKHKVKYIEKDQKVSVQ